MRASMLECEQPRLVLETPNRGLTKPPRRSRRTAEMQPTTRAARASAGNPHNMPVRAGDILPKGDDEDIRDWLGRLREAAAKEMSGR